MRTILIFVVGKIELDARLESFASQDTKETTTTTSRFSGVSSRRMSADAILPLEARNEKRTTLLIIAVTVPGRRSGVVSSSFRRRCRLRRRVNANWRYPRLLSMLLDS